MKTLLIDNFDSFTYNLYQLIADVNRLPPLVVKNNQYSWQQLKQFNFDNIVISPGPGRPDNGKDFGVCRDVILHARVPVLGVCLGHQGLCLYQGGEIDYAETVMHGRISRVHHQSKGLFNGIDSPFHAMRYYSLLVGTGPGSMEVTAYTDDQIVMAVAHKQRPMWGLQFHPESICTQSGSRILKNFRDLSVQYIKQQQGMLEHGTPSPVKANKVAEAVADAVQPKLSIVYKKLSLYADSEQVFNQFYGKSENAFWLDSSLLGDSARFSFMGDDSGPLAEIIYSDDGQQVCKGTRLEKTDIFSFLGNQLETLAVPQQDLPFDFQLGYVGYLAYELKSLCGYSTQHNNTTADAQFIFADRLLAFDHIENCIYLVCADELAQIKRAERWIAETEKKLQALENVLALAKQGPQAQPYDIEKLLLGVKFAQQKTQYLDAIASAKADIKAGESYELCLTNMLSKETAVDPLTLYSILRRDNPAPYACFLKFKDLHILSSSPERFITVDAQGVVESKPIKGTRKRGANVLEDEALVSDLLNNEKDRAENLMIVDLLRNDLGQVSDIGSVQVSKLFDVESYATVHQLVSTIRSRLRRDKSAVDCIKACFPGGSMTGAPKKRTLEILDRLETRARGVYSGSIGYFSLTACADFNIVIRTMLIRNSIAEIGIGGAIVDLSEAESEWQEILIKSQALLAAIDKAERQSAQFAAESEKAPSLK